MNLRQLEIFVKVAETGSFSKTASQLFMTQPTVSAHITALEKELNARLFVRNTREVKISEEGKELYQYARRITALEKEIEENFRVRENVDNQNIIIAASTIPTQYLLPEILLQFNLKYPKRQLKVLEMDSGQVVKYISCYMADVGFTGTVLEQRNCKYIPIYEDQLVIITPNQEKYRMLQKCKKDDISWILKEHIIMREEGSGTRREVEKMMKNVGIDLRKLEIIISIDNPEMIKKSVRQGMGISVLSKLAVEEDIDAGNMLSFKIPQADGRRNINLVYNQNVQMTKNIKCFVDVVKEIYLGNADGTI